MEFFLTSLVVVAIPGTGAIFTLSEATTRGHRSGLIAAFGCTLGIVPHLALAVTGLASILYAKPEIFDIIKYAGVAYLVYMAAMMWFDKSTLEVGSEARGTARQTIRHAVAINLLNPKLTIFFFAFLPQFTGSGPGSAWQMLGLGGVFMVLTFIVFVVYGSAAAAIRDRVISNQKTLTVIRRVFAASFLALSIRLATTQQ